MTEIRRFQIPYTITREAFEEAVRQAEAHRSRLTLIHTPEIAFVMRPWWGLFAQFTRTR